MSQSGKVIELASANIICGHGYLGLEDAAIINPEGKRARATKNLLDQFEYQGTTYNLVATKLSSTDEKHWIITDVELPLGQQFTTPNGFTHIVKQEGDKIGKVSENLHLYQTVRLETYATPPANTDLVFDCDEKAVVLDPDKVVHLIVDSECLNWTVFNTKYGTEAANETGRNEYFEYGQNQYAMVQLDDCATDSGLPVLWIVTSEEVEETRQVIYTNTSYIRVPVCGYASNLLEDDRLTFMKLIPAMSSRNRNRGSIDYSKREEESQPNYHRRKSNDEPLDYLTKQLEQTMETFKTSDLGTIKELAFEQMVQTLFQMEEFIFDRRRNTYRDVRRGDRSRGTGRYNHGRDCECRDCRICARKPGY